jgi:hypothetical protein
MDVASFADIEEEFMRRVALRLTPWRIELWSLGDMVGGKPPRVWRADTQT